MRGKTLHFRQDSGDLEYCKQSGSGLITDIITMVGVRFIRLIHGKTSLSYKQTGP